MSSVEIRKNNLKPTRTTSNNNEGDNNSVSEDGTHAFQKPPPVSVLKKILENRYPDTNSKPSLSKIPQPAVSRPETRHHLIDIHGLALFLRRATRCLQCYKTGSLSMMGNISRQQPPFVTKITIKCQNCNFILSQDLKKPKPTSSVDNSKLNESETNSLSSSRELSNSAASSIPLEEVWIQEEQDDKEPPEKKRKDSPDDPLNFSFTDRNKKFSQQSLKMPPKGIETDSLFNSSFLAAPLDFPKPKLNIYWVPKDKNKNCSEASVNNEDIISRETRVNLPFEEKKRQNAEISPQPVPNCTRTSLLGYKDTFSKNDLRELSGKHFPRCEDGINSGKTNMLGLMKNCDLNVPIHGQDKMSNSSNYQPEVSGPLHERAVSQNPFITSVVEDYEKVSDIGSTKKVNNNLNDLLNLNNEKSKAEGIALKLSSFNKETEGPDIKSSRCMDSITIENLNVSNINFQNKAPPHFNYQPTGKSNFDLRDARIITKLLNLTETLKSELIDRAKEIEKDNFERNKVKEDLVTPKIKDFYEQMKNVKKELERDSSEISQDRSDPSLLLDDTSPSTQSSVLFISKKDPELIVPDIYVKPLIESERSFQPESMNNESEMKCSSDVKCNLQNSVDIFSFSKLHDQNNLNKITKKMRDNKLSLFESEESENDNDENDDVKPSYRFHDLLSSDSDSNPSVFF